jgi:hypothetical protein
MEDMCKATTLPYKVDSFYLTDSIIMGESFSGRVKDCLTELCKDYDHEWSVLHGTLEVRIKGEVFEADSTAVLLSANTGMLGSPSLIVRTTEAPKTPEVKSKKKKKKTTDQEKIEQNAIEMKRLGVQVTAALNPDIKPGRLVAVQTIHNEQQISLTNPLDVQNLRLTVNRAYLVDTCHFYGNNYGGDFAVDILADIPDEENPYYQVALAGFLS